MGKRAHRHRLHPPNGLLHVELRRAAHEQLRRLAHEQVAGRLHSEDPSGAEHGGHGGDDGV
jgi:hypothetical protein